VEKEMSMNIMPTMKNRDEQAATSNWFEGATTRIEVLLWLHMASRLPWRQNRLTPRNREVLMQ
jgi:hypothetical protein